MTGYQLLICVFGLASLAVSFWAIWCVARSRVRRKAAWIVGSLFGFIGLGLNWTNPDELYLLFGIQIPPVLAFKVLTSQALIVKVQFPIVAIFALAASDLGEAGREANP